MEQYIIAMTINPNHLFYDDEIKNVAEQFRGYKGEYLEIVKHYHDDKNHYHVLLFSKYSTQWWKEQKCAHIESVRNVKAYKTYMNNHDAVATYQDGIEPYMENNNDDIVDTVIKYGAVKAVQIHGYRALRMYNALRQFEEDYNVYKAIHGNQ